LHCGPPLRKSPTLPQVVAGMNYYFDLTFKDQAGNAIPAEVCAPPSKGLLSS